MMLNEIRKRYLKSKNKNRDFTIFSSNCIGGVITSELGVRFNSPFVNLWLNAKDYLKFLKNPQKYLKCEMQFCKEKGINYPIGKLDDIKIYFFHYKTEQEAKCCWEKRKKRINFNNLYVIFTDRDNCEYSDLLEFDNLPYQNKIVFTHKIYNEIKSSVYIKGFESENQVGNLVALEGKIIKKHIYERFNYINWLNKD